MARYSRAALCFTVLLAVALSGSAPSTQLLLSIGGYEKISEVRVTRTVSEFVYKATLTNAGPPLAGATAQASSTSPATTIVEGALTFGPVGSGGSRQSTDTFTFRQDRTVAFDFSSIQWSITPIAANRAPVANAGPDQPIAGIGTLVSLNGTASSDPDGDALSYAWTLIQRPGGSASTLAAVTTATPTSVADKKGTYVAQLIVSDGTLASAPDTVTITVGNTAPVANAGPDQTAPVGTLVSLSGVGSTDADGDPLTFSWQLQSRPAGSAAVLSSTTTVNPTFTVDVAGAYTVRLIVNDGTVDSGADTVVIDTRNTVPIANAGADQTQSIGQTVNLSGAASSDADGNPLTYAWTLTVRPAGSTAVLSSPTAVNPTFVIDRAGTYRAQLIVNDGIANSAADTVDITTQNSIPIAEAGPNQSVTVGTTVTLNGSASTDVDGDPLTYLWSFTSTPAGSGATLSNLTSVMPTFVVDVPGSYVAQLIVNDGIGPSAPDTVTISTLNSGPIANAGPDQSLVVGQIVSLTGAGSSDADNNPLTYAWSFTMRPAGSTAALSSTTAVNPTFTADRPGTFIVQLIVNDGVVNSAPDTVTISSTNATPVANAGPDQLDVPISSTVTLDGSASSDANSQPLTYLWALLSKPAGSIAQLSNTTVVSPTFSADVAGDYVAQLIVNDGFASSAPDTVTVRVVQAALPVVSIVATDGTASESGGDTGTFTVSRTGSTANPLTVFYSVGGTATNGTDYQLIATSVVIPAGFVSAPITVSPNSDADVEATEDVALTISANVNYQIAAANAASVSITDGPVAQGLVNGFNHSGAITTVNQIDTWTFVANGGDTVSLSIGEVTDSNGLFWPWIRLIAPGGALIDQSLDPVVSQIDITNAAAGTYTVLVGSQTSASNTQGLGTYRLTMAKSPGIFVVPADDEGGPLTNGSNHTGTIHLGDLDQWTFTANAGDAIALSLGEVVDSGDFWPWIRLRGPNGVELDSSADPQVSQIDITAAQTGTYTVIIGTRVSSGGSVHRGTGTYRLTMAKTPGVFVTDPGDEGGNLPSGSVRGGTIHLGDLDQWTFNANAGDPLSISLTEVTDNDGAFWPWLRLRAPNGALLDTPSGPASAQVDRLAPVSGLYTIVVGTRVTSGGSVHRGVGTYSLQAFVGAPTVTVTASDPNASEAGLDTGTFTVTRTGATGSALPVTFSIAGSATAGSDYQNTLGTSVTIPAGQASATVTVTPLADGIAEASETVVLTLIDGAQYDLGAPGSQSATVTIADPSGDLPIVTVAATDSGAGENGPDTGTFTFTRTGVTTAALTVNFTVGGTATAGSDYPSLGTSVTIPIGSASTTAVVTPVQDGVAEPDESVILTLAAGSYSIGAPAAATVTIGDCNSAGGVLINGAMHCGTISTASEVDTWTFDAVAGDRLAVQIGQIADNNDFRPWIRLTAPNGTLLGNTSGINAAAIDVAATLTGTYVVQVASFDSGLDGTGSYRITLGRTPGPITVTPGDQGGPLINGAAHTGEILLGDLDVWTFNANAGDRIALNVGDIIDNNDFRPWIRLWAPNGQVLGNTSGVNAAAIDGVAAPLTGTYLVLISSFDSSLDGTGTYRLTLAQTPGPITVSPGDQGGPLTNGGTHLGEITRGDLDVWTFDAAVGDRIALQIGDILDPSDFRPWIRLYAPNGQVLANTSGVNAASIDSVAAPVAGTYLVLVASFDSGLDGEGTYRLTLGKSPGAPVTVTPGDQGGPLTNGAMHLGEITRGDLDVWTFSAVAGERLAVNVGDIVDTADLRPWLRLYAPNGQVLANTSGVNAAAIDGAIAPVTGTYLVLVSSFDSNLDGTGTYRLTVAQSGAPVSVSAADEGGPLTNGAMHTGETPRGDLDVWTFIAKAGDRIAVGIGDIIDTDDFRPWIRLYAPNGTVLANTSGVNAASIDGAIAPVDGTYEVLVASFDSGLDGTGTYRLTLAASPGPITVSPGDDGGPMTNGAMHTGELLRGDLDVWTFDAIAGQRIAVEIGDIVDNDDFRPWLRLYAPNGVVMANTSGVNAAGIDSLAAPVTGHYLVIVGSFDSGLDGTGTYRITLAKSPGPITVSAGDEGGAMTNGAIHTGEIVRGDLDVWTFNANTGERLSIAVGEIPDAVDDDLRPWLRVYAPNGTVLANTSGLNAAAMDSIVAPASGLYLVVVGTFDSGLDGSGLYRMTLAKTGEAATVSAGDEGGALANFVSGSGGIIPGDLDLWTFTAIAGQRISATLTQTSETSDFRPWLRIYAPNGVVMANTSGLDSAGIVNVAAPVSGTYLAIVGTFDSNLDGAGTYSVVTQVVTPP